MDITLLQDAFKYFAKFPLMSGVQKNFNVSVSSNFGSEYDSFRSEVDSLSEKELVPGIEDYVFGVNEDLVKRRVQDIHGIYLFVDYGAISLTYETDAMVETDDWKIAITVAYPVDESTMDAVEVMLMHQLSLDYLKKIKDIMITDNKKSRFVKQLSFPADINPWFARELMGSYGWSMLFSKKGVGLF